MITKKIIQLKPEQINDTSSSLVHSSVKVINFDDDFQNIVNEMIDIIKSMKIGVGLAAPQIGHNIQIFIANINKDKIEPTMVIVNPQIIKFSSEKNRQFESCLSVPYYRGLVERATKIEIKYQDRNGNFKEMIASEYLARVFQHEIDHLNGVLYPNRMIEDDLLEKTDFDWV